MTGLIERTLCRLEGQLPGRVWRPLDNRYIAATALWAKPIGRMPRAVAQCRTPQDVQLAILAARDAGLSLSVRGGGHDWAGRALCDGLVIDLSGMNDVLVEPDHLTARISGGARASDVLTVTDPRGLAAVTGSCGAVGMAGLTLGGGYGPLIGRFGLALDNLIAADVVLADGRIVTAEHDREEELFWALRGGGGNFGVVTAMRIRLHNLPNVLSMSLLLGLVQPIDESCKNLDDEMVATKAKGRGLLRHARGCTPEFVDEDGATRRDSGLHRLDEDVDAPAIERRKPACLHQGPLSVNDIRVECGQRGPIAHGVERVVEHRSKLEKWRDLGVALARRTAPCRYDQDHRCAVRADDESELHRQILGHRSGKVDAAFHYGFGFRERVDQHA